MIKLGLSIDDDKIEEELPTLEKDAPGAGEATANKMEEVDWFIFYVCILALYFIFTKNHSYSINVTFIDWLWFILNWAFWELKF